MSGKNQHYIPSFVQRAFGIRTKRRQWIWRFGREGEPECRRIKKTGSEDYFYSEPSADGRPSLDDAITALEDRISSTLNDIRSGSPGDPVDAEGAAAVVAHLATRTAHVRSTFGDGVRRLLERTEELFAAPANVGAMLGLDGEEPNRFVREVIANELDRWRPEIAATGIPIDVLERVGFALLKENWGDVAGQFADLAARLVDEVRGRTGEAIRDGHNRGLETAEGSSGLEATLRTFEWTVESGPATGAVLPAFGYNEDAARLSHDFFLAPRNDAETEGLRDTVGTGLGLALEESLEGAFDEFMPRRANAATDPDARKGSMGWMPTAQLGYDVRVAGWGDESVNRGVEDLLRAYVDAIAQALPLDRLDGIAVGEDYPATVRAVDRGYEGAPPAETVSAEVGVGIAKTVTVRRSGVVKGRIVLSTAVCAAITADDRLAADWGVQALVSQLARVAMIRMVDEALPGRLFAPAGGGLAGWLYEYVDGVPDAYIASWTAAAFVDGGATAGRERELLAWGLERLRTTAATARRAYTGEVTVTEFFDAVLPAIGNVLSFAASLLGHCGASGLPEVDGDDDLAEALERAGLGGWLEVYRADLERFRRRLGGWESFKEFLEFGRHVERLLWGIGMIVWEDGETMRYRMADGDVLFGTGAAR
ncbi:MAG: DUF4238 domain-containing protein [Gammaproteobacteria bacterium]|nr:DUF4238 domain-containing protein [Gammaproteobacteria bacterium]